MNKTSKILISLSIVLGLFIGFNACKKDYIDWVALEQDGIEVRENYLADNYETTEIIIDTINNITVTALIIGEDTIVPTKDGVNPALNGMYYIGPKDGEGIPPTPGRLVKIKYQGWLLDNTKAFYTDTIQYTYGMGGPYLGKVTQTLPGIDIGLINMTKGGEKATLIIPSQLAYGQAEFTNKYYIDEKDTVGVSVFIPKFSTLIFEVELLNAQK
jgi:hypothetical protein